MPKDLTSIQKFWQLKKRLPQPFETASFFISHFMYQNSHSVVTVKTKLFIFGLCDKSLMIISLPV